MKLMPIVLTVLGVLPIASHATTDWTTKLKPMLTGCGYADVGYDIAPIYKSAIVKKTTKVDDKNEVESPTHTTMLLKNSVAFGLPISRFKLDVSDGSYTQTVYFKSADFMKLRPLFKLPDVSEENKESIRTNPLGYTTQLASLRFNAKEKSISCSGYAS